ncbi:MAG TPA: ATP-binding cassette domain-containing protein [Chthonomonadaceae bacterium]|nr:ATP-binding cassette domain-containing protein [Chthonomonadaceae bacterium]
MSFLLSCQSLTKAYEPRPLFRGITLGLSEGERAGLIGPNGAGKSTFLKILAGLERADRGLVSARRGLRVGYAAQDDTFAPDVTVHSTLMGALDDSSRKPPQERIARPSMRAGRRWKRSAVRLPGTESTRIESLRLSVLPDAPVWNASPCVCSRVRYIGRSVQSAPRPVGRLAAGPPDGYFQYPTSILIERRSEWHPR